MERRTPLVCLGRFGGELWVFNGLGTHGFQYRKHMETEEEHSQHLEAFYSGNFEQAFRPHESHKKAPL